MDENQDTHWTPREPTVPVSNPYQDEVPVGIPPPPPHVLPPKQGHKGLMVALTALSFLVVVLSGGLFAVVYLGNQPHQAHPTATLAPTSQSTLSQSTLTPTVLLNRTPVAHIGSSFPAFLTSYSPTQAGLPYDSMSVFNYLLDTGAQMNSVGHSDGWDCCVAYQPEGKIVYWEEAYAVVVEVATFTTPTEALTDASDLRINSSGYSVYTRNLCLLFYDNSISNASLARYIAAMSAVCA